MSSHGRSVASEQLHADAEARAAQKRGERPFRRQPQPQHPSQGYGYQGRRQKPWNEQDTPRWRDRGDSGRDRFRYPTGTQEPPPKVEPGPTSEERAERELLRALAEPEWRSTVLKHIRPDDLYSEDGRRFARFVEAHQQELDA